MLPKWHAFLGIIFAFIIHTLFPEIHMFYIVLLFASSVLIDVDHYLYYAIKYKDISLKKAFYWFYDSEDFSERTPFFAVLHTIEFLIVFGIFSLSSLLLWSIFIGFLFHLFLDLFYSFYHKCFRLRYHSFLSYLLYLKEEKNGER